MILQMTDALSAYLETSVLVDWEHPAIDAWADTHSASGLTEEEIVRQAFHFVRDGIAHSWDIGSRRVTAKASDVLLYHEGICYAKSHLLAALLRHRGIPSGFCYQRLTLGDTPDTGFCIHALNTVYLASLGQWIRLDARGNRPGICAEFVPGEEHLAFAVREEVGEREYWVNFAHPHPKIAATLAAHDDCHALYACHLPTELP
jgi:transglutaminase-like putative cysteine protease